MSEHRLEERRVYPAEPHGALAAVLEPLLHKAAAGTEGRTPALVSLALEAGVGALPGEAVSVEAWVERATRTLVFAAAEVRRTADRALIASGSAVFKVGA